MKRYQYNCDDLMNLLEEHSDPDTGKEKQFNRYSEVEFRMGVSTAEIRKIAKETIPDVDVADCLWRKRAYESRVLAVLVCPPEEANSDLIEDWLRDTKSWAICDLISGELVAKNSKLFGSILDWSTSENLFLKRASLSSIACRAKDVNSLSNKDFAYCSKIIWTASDDDRKYIKKAASWAVREIGKIDIQSKGEAISLAEKMLADKSPYRNWVGKDAMNELKYLIKVPERPHLLSSKSPIGRKHAK